MYFNEIDAYCCTLLRRRFPAATVDERDVREVDPSDLDGHEQCHLFAGIGGFPLGLQWASWESPIWTVGFPCKQTSTAAAVHGRRVGLEGKDSGLWHEAVRLIEGCRPERIIIENVSGAASWAGEIEGRLEEIGYHVRQLRGTASGVGAPHRRRRMLWVADRDSTRLAFSWPPRPSEAASDSRRTIDRNPWLSPLPRGVRVADGLPGRLDRRKRIECVGNAVMPQLVAELARAMKGTP